MTPTREGKYRVDPGLMLCSRWLYVNEIPDSPIFVIDAKQCLVDLRDKVEDISQFGD